MNQYRDTREREDQFEHSRQWQLERERLQSEVSADVEALRSDTHHLVSDVREGARGMGRAARERWQRAQPSGMGSDLAAAARDNPVPTAMIGLGLGWLLWRTMQDRNASPQAHRSEGTGGRKERLQGKAQELRDDTRRGLKDARDAASSSVVDMKERARTQVQTARERGTSLYEENPLAFAGAATLAGVGIGLMLPVTRREREAYPPLRDRFVSQAKGAVVQKVEQAENTAKAASQVVKQGLGVDNGPQETEAH